MKFKAFTAALLAALLFTSCGTAGKLADSTDLSNGSLAGSVLSKFFSEFTGSGSIDFSKAQNILNIASLASSLTSLKGDVSNQTTQDFTRGLIQGSQNLVNSANSSSILGILSTLSNVNISGASSSMQKGNIAGADASAVISGLNSIMSLLKK